MSSALEEVISAGFVSDLRLHSLCGNYAIELVHWFTSCNQFAIQSRMYVTILCPDQTSSTFLAACYAKSCRKDLIFALTVS